jgi:predicted transcriptional regulator
MARLTKYRLGIRRFVTKRKKGKSMTETTPEEQVSEHKVKAVNYFNSNSVSDCIDELAEKYELLASSKKANNEVRARLQELVNTVEEFIKDNIKEGASPEEIKGLAEDCEISLEKEITVSFKVDYSVDVTVPMDFDIEKLNETSFDVSVNYIGSRNQGVEINNEDFTIEDFDVEED